MPANVSSVGDDVLTLDMLHQFAYCPRRFHLMYIEGRWAENVYTIEGRHIHRRVDQLDHILPEPGDGGDAGDEEKVESDGLRKSVPAGDESPVVSRSVPLSSDRLGLTAKLDLVSSDGCEAVPVETKRGHVPNNSERSYEPERVQLMAQGLLLREHGYHCDHGILYFAGSRTRVDVPFTDQLQTRTLELLTQAHLAANITQLPPPLDDSPKCNGCSLSGICLPDETLALQQVCVDPQAPTCRRLYPARENAVPLYVQEQGASVGKKGESLIIRKSSEQLAAARLKDVSQLVLCGNIQVSTQTLHLLCEASIPVVYLSTGHWFYGITAGLGLKNAFDRAAQFQAAQNPATCLTFARQLVVDKAVNQRAILRRNGEPPDADLRDMTGLTQSAADASSIASLLGIEGSIARLYFQNFSTFIKSGHMPGNWDFHRRNRRPPRDPINAMLSFAYALLVKECTVALIGEGLEPHWGLYHQPRHGRPALSLDIMEPLRPLIADSAVITAINTGMIRDHHFITGSSACLLQPAGRKALIQAFEARLDQLVTHPAFDYRCSWRAAIRLHARLLARWFRGDVPGYSSITTR